MTFSLWNFSVVVIGYVLNYIIGTGLSLIISVGAAIFIKAMITL